MYVIQNVALGLLAIMIYFIINTVLFSGKHGADLWLKNARGDLPLHDAALSGRIDLVKWLLQARPSQINVRNNDGRCPLHLAALTDNSDMCKVSISVSLSVKSLQIQYNHKLAALLLLLSKLLVLALY